MSDDFRRRRGSDADHRLLPMAALPRCSSSSMASGRRSRGPFLAVLTIVIASVAAAAGHQQAVVRGMKDAEAGSPLLINDSEQLSTMSARTSVNPHRALLQRIRGDGFPYWYVGVGAASLSAGLSMLCAFCGFKRCLLHTHLFKHPTFSCHRLPSLSIAVGARSSRAASRPTSFRASRLVRPSAN